MENKGNLTKENLSKRTDQKNASKTEYNFIETKISTEKAVSEKEEKLKMKKTTNQKETAEKNNEILKEMAVSESSYSRQVNDTEREDKSVSETKEDEIAKITDQLGKMNEDLLRDQVPSDGTKCAIKNWNKIDNVEKTGVNQCQQPFRDIIGKREQRREKLEKMEGDLRQRLDILECSVPAVMVWNIWRMAQGAPICKMKRTLEKQFKDASEFPYRSTPSHHYDCRVREVEAERKFALKKMEEARALWQEKLVILEEKKKKLESAKKVQEVQRNTMERLSEEVKALRDAMEIERKECQYGECGDAQCKRRWLDKVSSVTSIESRDIQCLEKLQQLAEEEMIMKKDIAELERREETYMRTLQQADELWSKMEDDTVSVTRALQEQLDTKTAANQQLADRVCELEDTLEKCETKMAACRAELEKLLSIEKFEVAIGRDNDIAEVTDKEVTVRPKVVHRPIGRIDDVATVKDDQMLARVEVADEEISAKIALVDADADATFIVDHKDIWVKPDSVDLAVDRQMDLVQIEDAESVVRPEDFIYQEQKFKKVREYLEKLGSLEELYKDNGEACPPDFVCNDEVFSPTGMTEEELVALGIEPTTTEPTEPTMKVDKEVIEIKPEEIIKEIDLIEDTEEKKVDTDKKLETEVGVEIKFDKEEIITVPEIPTEIFETDSTAKGEILMDAELPKTVPITTSPTIAFKKDLNSDVIPLTEPEMKKIEVDKAKIEEEIQIKEIVAERADEGNEKILEVQKVETEEEEIIPEHVEKIEMKDIPKETLIVEKEALIQKVEEIETPIEISENKVVKDVEKLKHISQFEEIKTADIKEEHAEIKKTEETKDIPSVVKIEEIEQIDTELQIPTVDIKEVKELAVDIISAIVDIIETENGEPDKIPFVDVEREKVTVKKIPLDTTEEEITVEEPQILDATIKKEAIEIKEPALVTDITQEVKAAELIMEKEIKEEIIKTEEPSLAEDILTEEKIYVDKLPLITDTVTEEQPTQEQVEKIEAITPTFEVEITKEKEEKIPAETISSIKLLKEIDKDELASMEKVKISAEITILMEPTIEDKEKEVPLIEKRPEITEVVEKIPVAATRFTERIETSAIPIDSQLAVQPYFITNIEERELFHITPAMKSSYIECSPKTCCRRPSLQITKPIKITQTDIVQQSEIVQITTQEASTATSRTPSEQIISRYLKASELKASAEIARDHPEITGRKMLWRKRLKDQSTVTTASTGSQTDRTNHVSHDRIERERTRVPTDELLRSIKIAAGLTRGDTEREIRTINYGRISDETNKIACSCCLCGRTTILPSIRPRLSVQPQIDVKTAMPPTAAFKRIFIPRKIDRLIPYDRLCLDCKVKIQGKVSREKQSIEEIVKEMLHDQGSCVCNIATSNDKPICHTVLQKRMIERKDQSCLAKILKRKNNNAEQKKTNYSQTISKPIKTLDIEPFSPSCICFKSEKSDVKPMRKGNCYCAD